jgi:hypothetical protein
MQDPRLRVVSTIALSVGSFVSLQGALVVMAWWLVFTPSFLMFRRSPGVLLPFVPIGLVSVAVQISGGDGLSYLIRLLSLTLVAIWMFQEWKGGEFLGTAVWFFGKRLGFEIGLAGEMILSSLSALRDDLSHILAALRLKGRGFGIRTFGEVAGLLVLRHLLRADEQADLLYSRGYRDGGTCCPRFVTAWSDIPAVSLSILAGIFAFIPFGDIFILVQ